MASSDRAVQAPVDVDALARDVAGLRRAEERGEERDVVRVAEVAERDVSRELGLALRRRVQAGVDLLTVPAPRGRAGCRGPRAPAVPPGGPRPSLPAGPGCHSHVEP